MTTAPADFVVVGGGIIGLATALRLSEVFVGAQIAVYEKEPAPAAHQTGRNSGVIHSGIYYRPGSLKARFARAGSRSVVELCEHHGIAHDVCGKLIVATEPDQVAPLRSLAERGAANGLDVALIGPGEARDHEPHVHCVAALHVPSTGIVDYAEVCRTLVRLGEARGVGYHYGRLVRHERRDASGHRLVVGDEPIRCRYLVACAGLHSDRFARRSGVDPQARIMPFRGEYYELVPERRDLVRNLIYPVPNPEFPFLGVHFTRMIGGGVHAGPNAVLALAREGYRWRDVDLRDVAEMIGYAGSWRLARRHFREGLAEVARSLSTRRFVASLRQLVPEIGPDDLERAPAGVRAQQLRRDGELVDDFLLVGGDDALHVCNAPSPAATSALEIAREIVDRVAADRPRGR